MLKKEQLELLNFINQVSFMVDDIVLYLDTHPCCPKGIEAYNHYSRLREEAVAEYSELYGPLNKYCVNVENCFDWINSPWPWEGACNC